MYNYNMDNGGNMDLLLFNTFVISNQRYRVYLRRAVLLWELENSPNERHIVPLSDIIAVNHGLGDSSSLLGSRTSAESKYLPASASTSPKQDFNSLIIHYAKPTMKNKWRTASIIFTHSDQQQVSSWWKTLENALKKQQRPKNFLVFVNPYCGKRKGVAIYNKTVKPILELGNVETNVIITTNGTHSKEIILSADLKQYDGILAVGGDGTISEIINALVIRTMRDENHNENDYNVTIPKIKIPVAIIPGGSTDCVAYSLNGTQDRQTAAIYAVLGDRCGLDICSVYAQNKLRRYFLSMLAYGFLGDVLKESEKHRWMGPKRYDYSGFLKVLKNKRYYCEVNMVLANLQPGIGPKCFQNCKSCGDTGPRSEKARYQEKNLEAIKNELKLPLEEKKSTERQVTVRGKYFNVGCANISCACERSPNGVAPHCHIGDGSMDVLLFKPESLIDILKLLLRSKTKNSNQALSDLPFIDIYKAKEVSVRVLDENFQPVNATQDGVRCHGASVWNCDGELVLDSNIRIKNYRQLLDVFSRRALPLDKLQTADCWNCYTCSKKNSNNLV